MPTITLSRKRIEEIIGKKIPTEHLQDRISMLGTDLEKIEGDEIVVEVFPNRPDMLSEHGFARALSSFMGINKGLHQYKVKKGDASFKVTVDKSVKDIRPYTACAIIKNLELNDEKIKEIIQIQEKLHITFGRNRKKLAIGIYPLEEISLPIKYLARMPSQIKFRPLESSKEMNGLQILSNHPSGREYGHLLEGKDRFPIFEDSKGEILSMPPIINSEKTGRVSENTKEVFIECSGFDYNSLSKCLNIIISALDDMGGDIYSMEIDYSSYGERKIMSPETNPEKIKADAKYINKLLGVKLSKEEIKELLSRMGIGYDEDENAIIPCYRADILHPIDIAEDVAIAYGYENFDPEIPNIATVASEDEFEIFKGRIADILIGLGLLETISYNLTNIKINSIKMLSEDKPVELENSLNSEYSCLRSWLLPGIIKIFSENTNKEYPQNIFEIGRVFNYDEDSETGVREEDGLCIALSSQDANFTKIRQILDSLLAALDLKSEVREASHPSFIDGRFGVVSASNSGKDEGPFAFLGEINPEILNNFGINMPVSALEINLEKLFITAIKKIK